MHIADSEWVPSTPEQTWKALHDPKALETCIAGCESVEQLSPTEYAVTLSARVGMTRQRFVGEILLSEEAAPRRCHVVFQGAGDHAGLAIGNADITLLPASHGTRIQYELHAAAGGALAQMSPPSLERLSRKLVDEFFTSFVDYMASHAAEYQPATVSTGQGALARNEGPVSKLSWLMVVGTVVLISLYYLYMR